MAGCSQLPSKDIRALYTPPLSRLMVRDKTVRIWGVDSGEVVSGPFRGHTGKVNSVTFSKVGGFIVSGSQDKTIRIWDADTSKTDLDSDINANWTISDDGWIRSQKFFRLLKAYISSSLRKSECETTSRLLIVLLDTMVHVHTTRKLI